MQKTVIIISLNFHPGHVSHLIASYKLCQNLGYKSLLYIDEQFSSFIPNGFDTIVYGKKRPKVADVAIFTFPSEKNLYEIGYLKYKLNTKIIYIFHEPLEKMSAYWKAGFSIRKLIKLVIINGINILTLKWSDVILIPSKKSLDLYDGNKRYKNKNRHYLPLMYDDELKDTHSKMPRIYFSYIGTIASDHSYKEYKEFVKYAIENNRLEGIKFLIATRTKVKKTQEIKNLIDTGKLTIYDGAPLRDEQINAYYASSFVVWNAYERTNQSGVLAKSFMFGTPAIVMKKNISEFMEDGKEVIEIVDNKSCDQIETAVTTILDNYQAYSNACRERFLTTFFYNNYNEKFSLIIDSCKYTNAE